ncbi:response regulator [bacterium]|nr:response regulator [bacterium]
MQKEILLLFRPSSHVSNALREVLEFEDYKVHQSDDPIELIKTIRDVGKLPYSLIIMEIKMAKLDGVDMLERLVKYQVKIPIILMSGHISQKDGIEFEQMGAFKYIAYPPDVYEFLDVVKKAVSLDHLEV